LLLDECPVAVENGVERRDHEADSCQDRAREAWEESRPQDVHEHAIPDPFRLVARLVLQGVVEDEELVVSPMVRTASDSDVDVAVLDGVDVVKHSQGNAQRTEVFSGGLFSVEHRDANRADVPVLPLKFWDVQGRGQVFAVPLEEDHATFLACHFDFQLAHDVSGVGSVDDVLDLILVRFGQVRDMIDAFVAVRRSMNRLNGESSQVKNPLPAK
jgi:hypothetical protein